MKSVCNISSQMFRVLCLALLVCATVIHIVQAAPDSKGTDFWLAYPGNYSGGPALTLFVTGDVNTSGTVSGPSFASIPFTVTAGTVTTVVLPSTLDIQNSDVVENKGIHVTALNEVTVYGLSRITATTDAYLGLPTDILGTDYIILGYMNVNVVNGTEFGLVGTVNGTTVTITPSVTTGPRVAGVPYNITLDQGQTYLLRCTASDPADLSGTFVTSTAPIGVFGGHQCANIPRGYVYCDHIVEMLPPTTAWGQSFVTVPLKTRLRGDTCRILASTNSTAITINGGLVATINRGQYYEAIIATASKIDANHPVLVAQYSNSSSWDGVTSDPFMMLIPPYEQFLAGYTVTTPATGFGLNFINVVAPIAAVGSIMLDGVAIPPASFSAIGASGFSGAQLTVTLGSHNLGGTLPFGAFVYGFDSYDSYGYPGGQSLAPVATVTSIALAPKNATNPVNTQHCVTATVRDQNSNPVVGVRVDFAVTGVNPTTGFANTIANGTAQFCYTGTNAGNDHIVASIGTLSDDANKTWTAGVVDLTPPSCVLTGVIPGPPKQILVTVQDIGSGLSSIVPVTLTNATMSVAPFTVGTTSAVLVTATKINQALSATIVLRSTDVAGNSVVCDPVYTTISADVPQEFTLGANYPNPFNP
ncbi:MAG TPA: hypothetical protein DGH68_04940, partial [Bacteroidetes bacterium]|nr:hypothetical protein [Bacteroidota bacterium]